MPVATERKFLETPIEFLKGVGPQKAEVLNGELGVFSIEDILHHFPFRYIDKTQIHKISEVNASEAYIQLKGKITNISTAGQKWNKRLVAKLNDGSGSIELVWFKGVNWFMKYLQPNAEYLVFGKPSIFNNKLNIVHPEIEIVSPESSTDDTPGLQPVYPSTEKLKAKGLDSRGLLRIIKTALTQIKEDDLPENLPDSIRNRYRFISRFRAYETLHFPQNENEMQQARARLKFEELFIIQAQLLQSKAIRHEISTGFILEKIDNYFNQFFDKNLPFPLTGAQKRVLKEIRKDVLSGKQMNRLLQGDVGSGKTIVALMTMLMALDNGYQACLMAPTEILAQQHFETIKELTKGLKLEIHLLTGSVKGKIRKQLLQYLEDGQIHILIGTHALAEEKVVFGNLGCVIIDEQHRFGVEQRARLWKKNVLPPHVLVMTATPIPRTLAMTVYGDLDISIIDEMPPGRKPVITTKRSDSSRLRVFGFLKEEIKKGRQVYIVYPLIQESEKMDYKDLMDGYESIMRDFPLPEYKVSIVHGKMKPEDRDYEMRRFVKGETDIMVATTVIEVGVNIPNASVMVIESAERFGLSQLHQLRGRVGRGADQSYCILMTGMKLTNEARIRIQTMCNTNDGFEIAEVDLQQRGPGDLSGTQQSGVVNLKIADIVKDARILTEARKAAEELLEEDPGLVKPENQSLNRYLRHQSKEKSGWSRIS